MYKLTKDNFGEPNSLVILRLSDKAHIPNDPSNRDWIAYQDWLSLGNTPESAD